MHLSSPSASRTLLHPLPSPTDLSTPSNAPPLASPTAAPVVPQQQLPFEVNDRIVRKRALLDREHEEEERGIEKLESLDRRWGVLTPRRDDGLPYAAGYPDCNYVGNDILSCFPLSNTTLVEGVWSKFIWNAQLPSFVGASFLDVYLYHADSQTVAKKYASEPNAQGMIAILPDDDWWRVETTRDWEGASNLTWPYYFIVVPANQTLNGAEVHQSTFSAIQTSMPASLLTTATPITTSSNSSRTSGSSNGGSSTLQPGSSNHSSSIPAWAIALLVIFGLAFLILLLIGGYFLLRYTRRRSLNAARSEGSGEPMLASGATANETREVPRETATVREVAQLQTPPAGISSGDAERMATAFRNALRGDSTEGHD